MFDHFRGRHKQYIDMKIGVKKDGTITAVQSRILLDGGAYTSFGVITAYYAGSMLPTLYKIPNYKYDGYRMYTNLPACGAMRGHGVPQPRFAFESLLDMIGRGPRHRPDRDPPAQRDDAGHASRCNDLDISSCEFTATLERRARRRAGGEKRGKLPPGKGIGVGCGGFVSGAGYPIYRSDFPHSNAVIRVHEDGKAVSLHIAAAEIGQGSDTVLPQIAAEELGIPYDRVWLVECDSVLGPIDLGSYSSRVTLMGGNAVKMAAAEVKAQLLRGRRPPARLRPARADRPRRPDLRRASTRSVGMDWDEAARLAFSQAARWSAPATTSRQPGLGGKYKGAAVGTSPAYSFSTAVCEVTRRPGDRLRDGRALHDFSDAGTVINPVTFHGQVEGGIIMGLGETLLEDTLHRPGRRAAQSRPARLPDPDDQRRAGDPLAGGRELRAARALRRQGDRRGLPAADPGRHRQRHLRRLRRAGHRAADHAGEDPARTASRRRKPRHRDAEARAATVSRSQRPRTAAATGPRRSPRAAPAKLDAAARRAPPA